MTNGTDSEPPTRFAGAPLTLPPATRSSAGNGPLLSHSRGTPSLAITVVPAQQNLRCRRGWLRSPLLPSNGIARGPISAAADSFTSKGALQSCESMYTTREEIGSGPGRVHRTVSSSGP